MIRRALIFTAILGLAQAGFAASYIVPPDDVLIGKAEAIVIARATNTWVEDTTEHGIQTVTEFTVEDTLKGSVPHTFRIRMPGGRFGKVFKIVPGTPRFEIGAQELLFVNRWSGADDYTTTDLALGRFTFKYDELSRRLALRDVDEIYGWDLTTKHPHREQRRLAEKFIAYIRAVSTGRPAQPDYFVPTRSLVGEPNVSATSLHPVAQACIFPACTATQYTLSSYVVGSPPCNTGNATNDATCAETGPGLRWTTFPSVVNWNRGNTETNAGTGGSDAINAAFAAWNGDTLSDVNYFLASTTANLNGITDAADGVNNVVFEKNLGSAFTCAGGGLLGEGGVNAASGSNMLGAETFFTTTEGDVSMNAGVGACIGQSPGIAVGDFNSAVTHEIGHTLGFRHSDQGRRTDLIMPQACTSFSTYECSSSAIMTAVVTLGLSATLQAWDQHAVETLYPGAGAPAAVTGVEAHATTSTNVRVAWNGLCVTTCNVYRSHFNDRTTFDLAGSSATSPFNDTVSSTTHAYLYKVRAFNGTTESVDSNLDLATTQIYTPDPLVIKSTIIKGTHITEIRTAVNAVRALAGIGPSGFTDVPPEGATVKAVQINELRQDLDAAMSILGLMTGGYTNTITSGALNIVRAIDFQELRNRVK